MRIIIILVSSLLFLFGTIKLFKAFSNGPSGKSKKAVKKSLQKASNKSLLQKIEPLLMKVAKPLSKIIPMNKYREKALQAALNYAGLDYSAKLFLAKNITIALLVSLCAIPFISMPVISIAVVGLGVLAALNEQSKVQKIAKDKKQYIEAEMPRFTQYIAQAVKNTSNIAVILEAYRPMAGKTFGEELSKTIADIKTSDVQSALKRLSNRINSSMVSEITRGLCSIDNGINQGSHFQLLAFTYRDRQNQLLKKEALKKPDKISAFGMVGLLGLLVQIFVILGTLLVNSMGVFNM